MKGQFVDRKKIARKRVKGLIVFLIVILFVILIYDVCLLVKGWIN